MGNILIVPSNYRRSFLRKIFDECIEHDKRYGSAHDILVKNFGDRVALSHLTVNLGVQHVTAQNILDDIEFYNRYLKKYPSHVPNYLVLDMVSDLYDLPLETIVKSSQMTRKAEPCPSSLPVFKGAIIHEMAHINSCDISRGVYFTFSALVAVHVFSKMCGNLVNNVFWKNISRYPFLKKQGVQSLIILTQGCLKIPSLVPKLACFVALVTVGDRHREKQADMQIVARECDPEVLRAMSDWFVAHSKKENSVMERVEFIVKFPKLAFLNKCSWLRSLMFDPKHPSSATRAAYFLKAAQELEKKQARSKK